MLAPLAIGVTPAGGLEERVRDDVSTVEGTVSTGAASGSMNPARLAGGCVRRTETSECSSYPCVTTIVRRALDLVAERKKVCITEDGIEC